MTSTHDRQKAPRRGFTLVELLTVLAIIAILLSFLMPGVTRIKEAARRAKCASNLHQIHSAMLMFAAKNGQRYPMAGVAYGDWWGSAWWLNYMNARDYFQLVDNYGGHPKVFQCPSTVTSANSSTPVVFTVGGSTVGEAAARSQAAANYPDNGTWVESSVTVAQFSYTYFGVSEITPVPGGGGQRAPYSVYLSDEKYDPPGNKYNTWQYSATSGYGCLSATNMGGQGEFTFFDADDLSNPPLMADYTLAWGAAGVAETDPSNGQTWNHGSSWSDAFINTLRRDGSVTGHFRRSENFPVTCTFPKPSSGSTFAGGTKSAGAFLYWSYGGWSAWWYR